MPNNNLPPLGYNLVLGSFKQIMDQLNQFQRAVDKTVKDTLKLDIDTSALPAATSGLENVSAALRGTGGVFDWLTARSVAAGIAIERFVSQSLSRLYQFAKGGIESAARVEELTGVLYVMGSRFGQTSTEIDAAIKSIKDLGITSEVAVTSLTQFTRSQISLSDATKLARTSQDAAVLSASDSSETLERVQTGIITGQSEILHNIGLMVNNELAYARMAKTVGKASVDQLTEQERVQARVNAVLEAGASIAGSYEAAMESAGKRLRSLTSRVIPEIATSIGTYFLPAFSNAVGGLEAFAKSILESVSAGGKLEPVLLKLKALGDIMTEGFTRAGKVIGDKLTDTIVVITTKLEVPIQRAAEWGFNLIANFAQGIAQGIATVLVGAMNMLSSMLAFFLQANSPPRVAPNLTKWGLAAMEAWLQGFTEADWSVMDSITNTLSDVFGSLTNLGIGNQDERNMLFAGIQEQLAQYMSTGEGAEAVINSVANASGIYAEQTAELVRRQLELNSALEEYQRLTKAIAAYRKQEENAAKSAQKLTSEYNKLVRSGANEATLKAKLAEVRAAQKTANLARDERLSAEESQELYEDTVETLKEQATLQQNVLRQLIEYAGLHAVTIEPLISTNGLKDKLKDALDEMEELPPPDLSKITKGVDKQFEDLKNKLREKLKNVFAPVVAAWSGPGGILDSIGKVRKAWQTLIGEIEKVIERIKKAFAEGGMPAVGALFENWFQAAIQYIVTNAPGWGQQIKAEADKVWDWLNQVALPAAAEIGGKISAWWNGWVTYIVTNAPGWGQQIKAEADKVWAYLFGTEETVSVPSGQTVTKQVPGAITNWWASAIASVKAKVPEWKTELGTTVSDIWSALPTEVKGVAGGIAGFVAFTGAATGISEALRGISTLAKKFGVLKQAIIGIVPLLGPQAPLILGIAALGAALVGLGAFFATHPQEWEKFTDLLSNVFGPVIERIKDAIIDLGPSLKELGPKFSALKEALRPAGEAIKGILIAIGYVGAVIAGLLAGVLIVIGDFVAAFIDNFDLILGGVIDIVTGIVNIVTGLVEAIITLFTGNTDNLKAAGEKMFLGLKQAALGILEVIGGIVMTIVQTVVGAFGDIIPGMKQKADEVIEKVKVWFQGVIDALKKLFGIASPSTVMIDIAQNFVQGFIDGVAGMVETMTTKVGEAWENVKTAVIGKLDELHTLIFGEEDGWATKLTKGFTNLWTGIKNTTAAMWEDIKEAIKGPLNTMIRWINGLLKGFNAVSSHLKLPAIGLIPELALGTKNWGGGPALVGEEGPELVIPPKGAEVWPANETSRWLASIKRLMDGLAAVEGQFTMLSASLAAPQFVSAGSASARSDKAAPQITFNTTINSGLDQATFEYRVRRVVMESLR